MGEGVILKQSNPTRWRPDIPSSFHLANYLASESRRRIHLPLGIYRRDTYIRADPCHILLESRERSRHLLGVIHLPFHTFLLARDELTPQ